MHACKYDNILVVSDAIVNDACMIIIDHELFDTLINETKQQLNNAWLTCEGVYS